jgi:hypothetical protein
VDDDGFADVVAGAPLYDAGQTDEGALFVFLGSAAGVASGNPVTAAALESNQANAQLGASVAPAGDLNGDGFADVAAGAPFYDGGQTDEGAAFVFLGSAAGIADGNIGPAVQYESDQAQARLGASAASAGDVNGDGFADVIVGAPFYDAPESAEGAAFVFLGNSAGLPVASEPGLPVPVARVASASATPPELDADGDGWANSCDCDLDQNGVCGASDWNILRSCFGLAVPAEGPPDDPSCAESDLDGSGVVGASDLNAVRSKLGASVEAACP